ncbi:MAG TPA: PIN domain-containing protein [archaeon]|nr:PIN domain-containing protein [archaeon]
MQAFVFDTYAIFEIISGNPDYEKYIQHPIIVNPFIVSELCYNLLKTKEQKTANEYTDKYAKYSETIGKEIIKEAMNFRYKNREKKLSMTDCISYFQAKALGIKFLTGDKEFENMPNVEFVK